MKGHMAALVTTMLIASTGVLAETVPYRVLVKDYQVCQSSFNGPKQFQDAYCMCTAIQLYTRIDLPEYVAMENEASGTGSSGGSSEGQKPNWLQPLLEISSYCNAQVTKE
jgi:hypothetical protein